MVGRQGRLDASTRIRSTGRGSRRFVGSCLLAPQGRRSGQRGILVSPNRQARLPRATGCGVARHRDGFAGIEQDRSLARDGARLRFSRSYRLRPTYRLGIANLRFDYATDFTLTTDLTGFFVPFFPVFLLRHPSTGTVPPRCTRIWSITVIWLAY